MDNYQAVFDAVRSRINHCDIGQAVENAIGRPDIDHHFRIAAQEITYAMTRPCVVFRPTISLDGDQWCALLGGSLADGVAGFGDTPEAAMAAFDAAWVAKGVKA